jgi:uncharacterized protein YgiM (DUF1202 family)
MRMAKRILFGLSLFLCASLAMAGNVRVKANKANVRAEPNLTARVVGTVARGETLEVIDTSKDWVKVKADRYTGWISTKLVEEVASSATKSTEKKAAASSSAPVESAPAEERTTERRAPAGEKKISFGVGGSFGNKEVGPGVDGRVVVRPLESLPALRAIGAFDYFFKEGRGWKLTANAVYAFGRSGSDVRPYAGGGLMYSHVSEVSETDLNLTAGVEYRRRFFGDVRVVFDPTVIIVSAGVKF